MKQHLLTALGVKHLHEPGYYLDGGGLHVQVSPTGSKSWIFQYRFNKRRRELGLGSLSIVSVADARLRAAQLRTQLAQGIDPLAERQAHLEAAKIAAARTKTFDQCVEAFIANMRANWTNDKSESAWRKSLKEYASPVFGSLAVSEVDTALVTKVLEEIWTTKTETASRVRGRIEKVLDWAKINGYRNGENPARWQGHLALVLASPKKVAPVEHHPAVPYEMQPDFMGKLRKASGMAARALEFAILTAARSNEVRAAEWAEIDWEKKVWSVPAARMKARIEHKVPLSDAAVALLRAAERLKTSTYLFPGQDLNSPLSSTALAAVLDRLGYAAYVPHGFRSTFRDWAGATTGHPREVIEHALAHRLKDKAEAAYARDSLIQKRRLLMDDWASYCGAPSAKVMDSSS